MGYNSQQKLKDNIEAIQIAVEWKQGQLLLPEQVEALKGYAGFGGLKALLYLNVPKEDLRLYPDISKLHRRLNII